MPDYQLSGGGASQDKIADGADESDGRWQTFYDGPLAGSAETVLSTAGSGASPTFNPELAFFDSETDGDWGSIICGGTGSSPQNEIELNAGALLIKAVFASTSLDSGTPDNDMVVGVIPDGQAPGGDNDNIAAWDPFNDRVIVNNGGTDNTADPGYTSDLFKKYQTFAVLVDVGGVYLTSGHTGFYKNSDPREGDSPTADIAATPDLSVDNRGYGVGFENEGGTSNMVVQHLEVAIRR
jgi:hypothetical protein